MHSYFLISVYLITLFDISTLNCFFSSMDMLYLKNIETTIGCRIEALLRYVILSLP